MAHQLALLPAVDGDQDGMIEFMSIRACVASSGFVNISKAHGVDLDPRCGVRRLADFCPKVRSPPCLPIFFPSTCIWFWAIMP